MTGREPRLFAALHRAFERKRPELDHATVRRRVLEGYAASAASGAGRFSQKWAVLLACAACAASLALWAAWPARATFAVAGGSGEVGQWLAASAKRDLRLDFSEGTNVVLAASSRARVTQLGSKGAHVELDRGSLSANVTHRPDTDWRFAAGPFEVEVVGTRLEVSWQPELGRFELRVLHGAVVVSGPLIVKPQEVRAGQLCQVDLQKQLMQLAEVNLASTPAGPEVSPAAPELTATPSSVAPAAPAEVASAAPRRASAEELLELATSARLKGEPEVERSALLTCRKQFPGHPAAARAAYLLGRASSAAEGARWFETYLKEQPGGLLAREASGRLIESHQHAGNVAAAERAASSYLAAYPNGPHAGIARRALAGSSTDRD